MSALASMLLCVMTAAPPKPALLHVEPARTLPIQFDGRVMPLDTYAHRALEKVSGGRYGRPADPVTIVLSWVFEPKKWLDEPLIKMGSDRLARALGTATGGGLASYRELAGNAELGHIVARAGSSLQQDKPLTDLEEQALQVRERVETFANIVAGVGLALIPHPESMAGGWMSPQNLHGYPQEPSERVKDAWQAVADAFLAGEPEGFAAAVADFRQNVAHLPGSEYPTAASLRREVFYNHLMPVRLAWMLMLAAAMVGLISRAVRQRWFDVLSILVQMAAFVILTVGLTLRWDIAGRIPAANFYESLVLLGWSVGAFSLISLAVLRDRTIPLNAAFLAGVFLAMADLLPIDPWIRPITPVLRNTVWMSIHVPIIMLSYAVVAQAVILAHIQVGLLAFGRANKPFSTKLDWQIYWCLLAGSLLLLVGILTGSMWANGSWGRYWGWDPKEVWSLAAFMGYIALLHARQMRWVGAFGTAVGSIAAIWLVVGTYLVVNFVLPVGLHSYAFGAGNIVSWMLVVAAVEALYVGVGYLRYGSRRLAVQPA
ncbi:MAG TPA: cytochrome c biogenesis protein CcsA [Phycisphaerae bacterium]|nr:cytochrome c biogenesis protein CcsA [Phycisphaerae bacterium]